MILPTASYGEQLRTWPQSGRHILAHFDAETIVVYQAYRPAIGHFAAKHGHFGGEFSYSRMSWIKPNFLWMMYRSDWGRSQGQEIVLAVRLRRSFFDLLLKQAVPSSFAPALFQNEAAWRTAVERSDMRLQWDPDHLPTGEKCERRAIQLGLRGETLGAYGKREIVEIIDLSDFVAEQRTKSGNWQSGGLQTPVEQVYVPADRTICDRLGLDSVNSTVRVVINSEEKEKPLPTGEAAGRTFTLPTKYGTLVVKVNDPDTAVRVFEEEGKIEIARKSENVPMTISVDSEKHVLKLQSGRTTFFAAKVEFQPDSKEGISAKLVPLQHEVGEE